MSFVRVRYRYGLLEIVIGPDLPRRWETAKVPDHHWRTAIRVNRHFPFVRVTRIPRVNSRAWRKMQARYGGHSLGNPSPRDK